MPIMKVPRETGKFLRVPRSFMRMSKLDPMAFRVLMHGRAYPRGWKPQKCARECGISLSSVKRAMKTLKEMGFAYTVPHPLNRKRFGYRFRFQPSMTDENKPWYNEMMRKNNGDLDGVLMLPKIDDGRWRREDEENG